MAWSSSVRINQPSRLSFLLLLPMNQTDPSPFGNFSSGSIHRNISFAYQDEYDHPLLCIKCNSNISVATRVFTYSHIPTYVYLILVLNLLVGLIVIALSSGQHRIELPYCNSCWRRYRIVSVLAGFSILVFFASIVGGVALMLNANSGYAFFPLPVLSIAFMIGLVALKRRYMPSVLRSNKHEVVVNAGCYGIVTFSKTTVAKFSHST